MRPLREEEWKRWVGGRASHMSHMRKDYEKGHSSTCNWTSHLVVGSWIMRMRICTIVGGAQASFRRWFISDATPRGSFSSPWTLKAPHYTAFFSNSLRRRRYRRFQLVLQLKPALIFIQWDTQRLQTRETSAAIRFDSASQTSITPAEAVRIISLGKLTRVRISWGASILHLFC